MKAAFLGVLEGFEDGDGIIRDVKSTDIAEMLAKDAMPGGDVEELRTLCEMLTSASDHVLDRYDSERERFIQRARQLASLVGQWVRDDAKAVNQ